MTSSLVFNVDGGCRRNGRPDAFGAAACILDSEPSGGAEAGQKIHESRTQRLEYTYPVVDCTRAELKAIIMALDWALEICRKGKVEHLNVTIRSDCLSVVESVKSRCTIRRSSDLTKQVVERHDSLVTMGANVNYEWIPRRQNSEADGLCNEVLAEMCLEHGIW